MGDLDARLDAFRRGEAGLDSIQLACDLVTAGRHVEAADVACEGLKAKPDSVLGLLALGRAMHAMGRGQDAQGALVKAARIERENPRVLAALAEVVHPKDAKKGRALLAHALKHGPKDPEVLAVRDRMEGRAAVAHAAPAAPAAPAPPVPPVGPPRASTPAPAAASPRASPAAPPHSPPAAPDRSAPPSRPVAATLPLGSDVFPKPGVQPLSFRPPHDADADDEDDEPTLQPGVRKLPAAPPAAAPPAAAPPAAAPPAAAPPRLARRPAAGQQSASPVPPAPPPRAPAPPSPAGPPPQVPIASPAAGPPPLVPMASPPAAPMPAGPPLVPAHADALDRPPLAPIAPPPPLPSAPLGDPSSDEPEAVLESLVRAGVLDMEEGKAEPRPWQRPPRSRAGGILWWVALWLVLALVMGGLVYKRIHDVRERERASAEGLTIASAAAQKGDVASLRVAVEKLRVARALDARNGEVAAELAFVESLRVLDHGDGSLGEARAAISRADALKAKSTSLDLAKAAIALVGVEADVAVQALEPAVRRSPNDARVKYVQAVLAERLGDVGAAARYDQALGASDPIASIGLALCQVYAELGDAARARAVTSRVGALQTPAALATRSLVEATFGDPQGAVALARQALEKPADLGPNPRLVARTALARGLRRAGDLPGARGAIEGAIREPGLEPRTWRLLADEALAVGEPARAEQAAARAVSLAPLQSLGRLVQARVHLARRRPEDAIAALQALPDADLTASLLRAQALLLDGKAADAAALLGPVVEANPTDSGAKLLLLRARVRTGDENGIRRAAEAIEHESADDPEVLRGVADVLLAVGDHRAALRRLEKALELRPADPELLLLQGEALRESGDLERAVSAFLGAHSANTDLVEALVAAGDIEMDRGRYEEARRIFERAAGLPRNRTTSRIKAAEAALAMRDLVAAGRFADQAAGRREPARVTVLRARIAIARGEPAEAEKLLDPLLSGERPSATLLALRGDARALAGQLRQAIADYEAALAASEDLPEALVGMAEVLLARRDVREAKKKVDDALSALRRRQRLPSLRARAYVVLARIALAKGAAGRRAAKQALEEAITADGNLPDAQYLMGVVHVRARDREAAKPFFRRYLELAPDGPHAEEARRYRGAE